MVTFIALFRGINVGGKNILPMKSLIQILENHDYIDAKTYIQSGNVVFRTTPEKADLFIEKISKSILKKHGFQPHIIILDASKYKVITKENPFKEAELEPKFLHLYFLADSPNSPDINALNDLKTTAESFKLTKNAFYLHAPEGIGRSKLAAKTEKLIGVKTTARNWRTVSKLLEMSKNCDLKQ